MDIDKVIEKSLRIAETLGASEAEVYVVEKNSVNVSTNLNRFKNVRKGNSLSFHIRIALGKKIVSQGFFVSSEEDVYNLIEKSVSMARVVPEDQHWVSLPRSYGRSLVFDLVDDRIKNVDISWLIEFVEKVVDMVKEVDRRVSANFVGVESSYMRKWIGNSYEKPMFFDKTIFYVDLSVKAVENSCENYYSNYYVAPTLKEFNVGEFVENTVNVVITTMKSKSIDTGVYNVVFMPRVFASILKILLAPAIRADQVQKNRSPLRGKLFSEVFAEDVTIVDDGSAPNMIGSGVFDDEGVATTRKIVVDKGMLITYLYDTYTAYIDNRESTGNAIRYGLSSPLVPDITNLIVVPGRVLIEDIVRDVGEVIIVYSTIGEWLSSFVNGNLSASIVNGVYVKNGVYVHGVKNVVISGNLYKFLGSDLIAVSRDVDVVGNMFVPAVCVRNISVAGK